MNSCISRDPNNYWLQALFVRFESQKMAARYHELCSHGSVWPSQWLLFTMICDV
jgi:hypothetical protein